MQLKRILPIVLGVVLLTVSASSAFADPLFAGGNVAVGDRYDVTTLTGTAQAWIDGHWITGPANLELQVQVTYVGLHNIVFKVISGSFQVRYKPYIIDAGHWRGDYNRDTRTSGYQGPATAPDGRQGYFVLYGEDAGHNGTGVYMHILSDFRGEYDALWHVDLHAFRYKLN